jgi:glutathione synthase
VAIYRRLPSDEAPLKHGDAQGHARAGEGTRKRCGLAASDQHIVDLLRAKLVADGLYFVGMDIVGTKVLELNVHTPGGFHANQTLYGFDVADMVVRDLECRVELRRASRKTLERVA